MKHYPIWSYLSIYAIDAPLISVTWYLYLAQKFEETSFQLDNCIILASSVWLGYMADRLFDVKFKKKDTFLSLRHQFCKDQEPKIWILWFAFIIITAIFSAFSINSDKIVVGLYLVLFILIYNLLNQRFSKNKFPKEFFVALIFACGTCFLIENPIKLGDFIKFF